MASSTVRVVIDQKALNRAAKNGEGVEAILKKRVDEIVNRANSLSSGMRTGLYYDHAKGMRVGDTQPKFVGDVKKRGDGFVGIVHAKNYAAMKADHEHNILLKAKG